MTHTPREALDLIDRLAQSRAIAYQARGRNARGWLDILAVIERVEDESDEGAINGVRRLQQTLASPPEDWYTFGTHVDHPDQELEFWGDDGTGTPIWERPIPTTITMEQFEDARIAYVQAWEAKDEQIGQGFAIPGLRSTVGLVAALRVLGIERQPKRDLL